MHFQQAIGRRPIHPIQVLARAYRADGFATPVTPLKVDHQKYQAEQQLDPAQLEELSADLE